MNSVYRGKLDFLFKCISTMISLPFGRELGPYLLLINILPAGITELSNKTVYTMSYGENKLKPL